MWSRLFPESCPACACATIEGFCAGCRGDFARVRDPCPVCGLPPDARADCPGRTSDWRVSRLVAPFAYADPLRHYLHSLKFSHGRRLGRALGLLLADALDKEHWDGSVLVAVPLHARRLRERGYNQALEISLGLGRALGLETRLSGAVRVGAALPQSRLGARARRANVAAAYRVDGRFFGRGVTIVDDVVTTGATVNALAAALLAAGAARVDALAVARTVPPRSSGAEGRPPRSRSCPFAGAGGSSREA
ncbi:MAG TPA: ComF family protein [Gammaproteobacteria bacterium]|nr:ComF family protein [Gammaproteobacteria bacterium]